jgi:hypothetical protein
MLARIAWASAIASPKAPQVHRHARRLEAIQQLGMITPRPRPGVDRGQALRVDLDDRHLAARRAVEESRANLGQTVFDGLEAAAAEQDDR